MNGRQKIEVWFKNKSWDILPFQEKTWNAFQNGKNGMINAPTGSGKTYSIGLAVLEQYLDSNKDFSQKKGIQVIWVTPIRALAKEIESTLSEACSALNVPWIVAKRTGDTSQKERNAQKKTPPQVLITTPESLHLLLASKGYDQVFKNLKCVVVDEWHELLGTKRAVQMELALSRFKGVSADFKIWGISATIGNLKDSLKVLLGNDNYLKNAVLIKSNIEKRINVHTVLPDEIETLPWAGHLGIKMLGKLIPIIENNKSTLIFTNTRAQAEIWYQRLLEEKPEFAGQIAMHHGSISRDLRNWVEEALHNGLLKAVVCTSSLDLGVDFRPVENIIQIGSPKGIARFVQRAGRSGHQPGAASTIYFVPTHALEIIESAALQDAINLNNIESRIPHYRSFDVLVQYLVSLAVSDGFFPKIIFNEIKNTFSYETLSEDEWNWALQFISKGGKSLKNYQEFNKVHVGENGLYRVNDRKIAMRHRLSIGTIVSEPIIRVCFLSGKTIGTIEEYFIARLKHGEVFWFAGRSLEFVKMVGTNAIVKRSNKKTGKVPSWQGGRMPLSSSLSQGLRKMINLSISQTLSSPELLKIQPLILQQEKHSHVPKLNEFLIETLESDDGFHAFFYPFEGRLVHEGMAAILAYRISLLIPISFSIALNDYGFELLSDQAIPVKEAIENDFFSIEHLEEDINASINSSEMARRKFRDIAGISGLVFKGFPGKNKKDRHLQASSQLFFEVFNDYEPLNLLYLQAFEEVREFQLEESRLKGAMKRIQNQEIVHVELKEISPFSFPIMVDRLREHMSNEKLEDRIKKMILKNAG